MFVLNFEKPPPPPTVVTEPSLIIYLKKKILDTIDRFNHPGEEGRRKGAVGAGELYLVCTEVEGHGMTKPGFIEAKRDTN